MFIKQHTTYSMSNFIFIYGRYLGVWVNRKIKLNQVFYRYKSSVCQNKCDAASPPTDKQLCEVFKLSRKNISLYHHNIERIN
jgi:hypothetical protein